MFKEISKIDKEHYTYNGTYVDGTLFENHLFSKGDPIIVADAWVNARGPREACNKLLDRLYLPQYSYKYKEEYEDAIKWGYLQVEEVNYYDEEDDCTYKYYCKVIYLDEKKKYNK